MATFSDLRTLKKPVTPIRARMKGFLRSTLNPKPQTPRKEGGMQIDLPKDENA